MRVLMLRFADTGQARRARKMEQPQKHLAGRRMIFGAVTEIVSKLTANAIAYGKPHGSVTLQVSLIAPERLRISVFDTGIGVPAAEEQKSFRPFPHVARPVLPSEGVGLGLATCQALANLMGGSVGFRSVPDQGSEFWLDLPVALASIVPSTPT